MDKRIKKARFFAKLFDTQFSIFGIKFGIDPIVNIIPYLGSIFGVVLNIYILKIAYEIGVSKLDFLKMIRNIIIDFLLGAVPYLGIIFDVVYKANIRNIVILEKYSYGKFVEGEIL